MAKGAKGSIPFKVKRNIGVGGTGRWDAAGTRKTYFRGDTVTVLSPRGNKTSRRKGR